MRKINCPYCNHKPFRNDTGLNWHLKRFHENNSVNSDKSGIDIPGNLPKLNEKWKYSMQG
jgi:hypothetical protein